MRYGNSSRSVDRRYGNTAAATTTANDPIDDGDMAYQLFCFVGFPTCDMGLGYLTSDPIDDGDIALFWRLMDQYGEQVRPREWSIFEIWEAYKKNILTVPPALRLLCATNQALLADVV